MLNISLISIFNVAVLRFTLISDFEYKEDVHKLMNALVNILAIVKHFQNKIKDWLASQGLSTPTEEQVLDVVRKNYDLTLKLQDSLDHYERYVERPKHTQFFTSIVRDVVIDTRKHVNAGIKEAIQNIPQELMCNVVSSTTGAVASNVTSAHAMSSSTQISSSIASV